MANEKTYSAHQAALAVLAKAQELLAKSSIVKTEAPAKIAEGQSGMHTVGYYSNKSFEKTESLDCGFEPFQKAETGHEKGINTQSDPSQRSRVMMGTSKAGSQMPLSRDAATRHEDKKDAVKEHKKILGEMHQMPKPNLPKSENPDEKQDAKLGEEVEGLCERHMLENKGAERKEGHKIVKSELCKMCKGGNDMSKSEFAELYEDLAKMEKKEKAGENEIGTKFVKAENKDAPSNPMKPKIEEKPIERDNKNFETQPGKSNTPPDARQAPQAAPQANPAEQKEGNNPPAGSVPGKGIHKLSFFMGHRHNKRNGQKPPVNG